MILKNDVLASKGSLQGIYGVYQTTNGRTSWKSGSKAIWFVPRWNDWAIGDLKNFGAKTWEIKTDDVNRDDSPSDIPNYKWMYYDNIEWIKPGISGDIQIKCVDFDKGNNNSKLKLKQNFYNVDYLCYLST